MEESSMDAALEHAQNRVRFLSRCDEIYIIHLALKELGVPVNEGYLYAKYSAYLLYKDPVAKLSNGVYAEASILCGHPTDEKHVEQLIRSVIKVAWNNRNVKIWECYFPIGKVGRTECPSNKDFLMAIVDYVVMWKGFCEEVNYERK